MYTSTEIFERDAMWIVQLAALRPDNVQFGTGSAFICRGHIVTCGHNISVNAANTLVAMFHGTVWAGAQSAQFAKPHDHLKGYSDENSYDFAILDSFPDRQKFSGLELTDRDPNVGEPVVSLGYPLDDGQLTMHAGIVSAVYKSGPATMLKLDMSVNAGNSGGPLISLVDGKVLGVVVRKATGLTRAFDQLEAVMRQNLTALSQPSGGRVIVGGIDPVELARATQTQLQHLASEIRRSANVGIGYAIYVDPLRNEQSLA